MHYFSHWLQPSQSLHPSVCLCVQHFLFSNISSYSLEPHRDHHYITRRIQSVSAQGATHPRGTFPRPDVYLPETPKGKKRMRRWRFYILLWPPFERHRALSIPPPSPAVISWTLPRFFICSFSSVHTDYFSFFNSVLFCRLTQICILYFWILQVSKYL